jgi:hypothetical protein
VSPVEAGCPACGAPVTFKIGSSIVTVCEFCKSVVARGDRQLEDLGKVADLVETGSPLSVGLHGSFRNTFFELTGHAQLGHAAGGLWDEWYAAFADGRWGWLAEAQGRFYLTFQLDLPEQSLIPPFEALQLGQPVPGIPGSVPMMVAEKGEAAQLGAKGEIPYRLVPGETYQYADLAGPGGVFGTIDYSEGRPLVFIGREVTLADLGILGVAASEREPHRVAALQLSCPQCAGPLDLRAPDQTQRVTCPNCGSLLDVSEGKLQFLSALLPGKVVPVIPIGSVGDFAGTQLTIIGFMQRSVEFEGVRYFWEEYLLYNSQVGFRWLVRSDDHWNFVQTVSPGEVSDRGKAAYLGPNRFRLFQDAVGRVEYVVGEFYWKVTVGETVYMADYIRPPQMLSKEVSTVSGVAPQEANPQTPQRKGKKGRTPKMTGEEVNWSLGTYVERKAVEKTFGVSGLPRPSTVAPNQVFPHKKVYKYWAILSLIAFVFGLFVVATGSRRLVYQESFTLQPMENAQKPHVLFIEQPIDLRARQNIRVSATANVNNSWLFIEGDFVEEATGVVQAFAVPVEYYHGVDGGESWTEGDLKPDVYVSALPAGKYTMRLEVSWEKWQSPASFSVTVMQGVPRVSHIFIALLLLSIIPVLVAWKHFSFARRRWKDSDYSPFQSNQ